MSMHHVNLNADNKFHKFTKRMDQDPTAHKHFSIQLSPKHVKLKSVNNRQQIYTYKLHINSRLANPHQ